MSEAHVGACSCAPSSRAWRIEMSRSVSSSPTPREIPRLGFESQSRATTGRPFRASVRAITEDVVVLPDPPLPTTASFIRHLPWLHRLRRGGPPKTLPPPPRQNQGHRRSVPVD